MDLGSFRERKVLVTGGAGFLGSHLVERLARAGCTQILAPRSRDVDLTDAAATRAYFEAHRPALVFHLAARVGGIGANQKNPGTYFRDNLLMGVNVLEMARALGTELTVLAGTICAYPKHTPVPFREQHLWDGYPEETNAPYGVAKKALLVMADAYRRQFGVRSIYLLPVNLYGPRDNFDLESSHVIPAMIRKCLEARASGASALTLWGDGSPTREFLYVDDCAEAFVRAAATGDHPEPINVGSGLEVSIRELATTVAKLTGFEGRIEWDATRPNGQPRRCLDISRAKQVLGFEASTTLQDGLRATLDWYATHNAPRTQEMA